MLLANRIAALENQTAQRVDDVPEDFDPRSIYRFVAKMAFMPPTTEPLMLTSILVVSGSFCVSSVQSAVHEARASGSGYLWVVMRIFFLPLRMLSSFLARGRWREPRSTEMARPTAVSTHDSTKDVIGVASLAWSGAVWLADGTSFHRLVEDDA